MFRRARSEAGDAGESLALPLVPLAIRPVRTRASGHRPCLKATPSSASPPPSAPALTGAPVVALELPRSDQPCGVGSSAAAVERVEARGKNLLIFFDEGTVLHTHLRMSGPGTSTARARRWKRSEGDGVWPSSRSRATSPSASARPSRACSARAPCAAIVSSAASARICSATPSTPPRRSCRLRALDEVPLGVASWTSASSPASATSTSEPPLPDAARPLRPVRAYSDEELSAMLDVGRRLLQSNVVTPILGLPVDGGLGVGEVIFPWETKEKRILLGFASPKCDWSTPSVRYRNNNSLRAQIPTPIQTTAQVCSLYRTSDNWPKVITSRPTFEFHNGASAQ